MTFLDLWSELKAYVPNLPTNLAKRFINRALRVIYAERPWSFLFAEASMVSPALINSGTVAVTQGTTSVVPDATALAAFTGLTNPLITRRQIKFGDSDVIYNIAGYDGVTLTLDRSFTGTTNASSAYSVFQCYYSPPSTDFLRWVSVTDVQNGHELDMQYTKEQIERIDPQRTSTGDPLILAQHMAVPSGFWDANVNVGDPLYELWPHPTNYRVYQVIYQRRGLALSADADTVPSSVDTELVLAKSRQLALDWKLSVEPEFLNAYRSLGATLREEYRERLRLAMVQDDELFITQWQPRIGPRGSRTWDSNWAQSHAVPGGS